MSAVTIPQALDLGRQHHQAGQLAEAEAIYRQIIALDPANADATHLLGVLLHQLGRPGAAELVARSIELRPDAADFLSNYGYLLKDLRRWDEAIAVLRRAVTLNPSMAAAYNNLGMVLQFKGAFAEAAEACRAALRLIPDYPEAWNNLGNALSNQGLEQDAIAAYQRSLELQPQSADVSSNLGTSLQNLGRYDEAVTAYRSAIAADATSSEAWSNLGGALKDLGQLDESIVCTRESMRLEPGSAVFHSNLIYTLCFSPTVSTTAIREEMAAWVKQHGSSTDRSYGSHTTYSNTRAPSRKLRIGYVSPDFFDHVVGRNMWPLLRDHDRTDFDVFIYSGVLRPDAATERFRALATGWRNIVGVSDEQMSTWVREDGIDILVDLTLHMVGNRLPVFARRPAPVQVTFAGYPDTTGLQAIDYRLTDPFLDPPDADSTSSAETPVRLPDSFWCYDPQTAEPPVNDLPALSTGHVTFGCLNNFCKVNPAMLAVWARVFAAVENSRLLLLAPEGKTRARMQAVLRDLGVDPARVEFVSKCSRTDYLALHHRIDLALDTYPYTGHTTSCDALWMGVPVVSLTGTTPISRGSFSLLSNVGLAELASETADAFVKTATDLALDLPRLAGLRAGLRQRMRASPLMDAARFTRNIEAAYRTMWMRWCEQITSAS